MRDYFVALKGTPRDWASQSQARMDEVMALYRAWVAQLSAENRFKQGDALSRDSRVIRKSEDGWKVDGPFPETKELLTGYFVIRAKDMPEAIAVAQGCPAFVHGDHLEIYEMDA